MTCHSNRGSVLDVAVGTGALVAAGVGGRGVSIGDDVLVGGAVVGMVTTGVGLLLLRCNRLPTKAINATIIVAAALMMATVIVVSLDEPPLRGDLPRRDICFAPSRFNTTTSG